MREELRVRKIPEFQANESLTTDLARTQQVEELL